jgi:serine/threonine protein kinase
MGNKASKKKKAEAEAAKKKQQNKSTSGGSNGNTNNKSTNPEKKEPRPSMVSQKKVSLEDFVLLTTVGKGSFGKVIQVRKKDSGQIYAMKVLKKAQVIRRKQYEHTMTERHILEEVKIYIFLGIKWTDPVFQQSPKNCRSDIVFSCCFSPCSVVQIEHPFIVSLRFAFQTSQKLYMVFDFFNGGELFHYLSTGGRFDAARAQFYAAEIASGMGHLHSIGIIYRDLKPENLILDANGHIRITDFGLSKEGVEGDKDVGSFCGTPEYLAPEVLKREPYGKVVDWWSYGTLVYEMIHGLPPYYNRNREKMYRSILHDKLEFPDHMNTECKDFLRSLLIRDPNLRLGYNGVDEIKAHQYFQNIDWVKLDKKELDPPYRPDVKSDSDVQHIDDTFTNMPAAVTMTPAGKGGGGGWGGGWLLLFSLFFCVGWRME